MLLKEHLEGYTKEELLDQARNLELRKCSGLRKAALIDRIAGNFCTEEMLRSRLACLTEEQLDLFRKACAVPQDLSIDEVMDGMQLYRYWTGYFDDSTDRFCVFEDIKEIFDRIDDEAFRADQYKKGWMMKCLDFFINYYGIAPVEIMYELYQLKVKSTIEEMTGMLSEMPVDIVESCIFSMDSLGLQDWPEDDPLYSSRGILVHAPVFEEDGFDHLLKKQMGKDFYIPSAQLIEEMCRKGYEASSSSYKQLETFFMKQLELPYDRAVTWCFLVWANGYEGKAPAEVISKMAEADVVFKSEEQQKDFEKLLADARNDTRMKENRGHKMSV